MDVHLTAHHKVARLHTTK